MKLIVGLTGGIGSGKSEVARLFELLGIAVYFADEASKNLVDCNPEIKDKLVHAFGSKVYNNSKLDRKVFASLIFQNDDSLALANKIIHPYVFDDFENWIKTQSQSHYLVIEAAILFESRANERLNKIIVVYSPEELRIARVMKRDGCTREEVLSRMNKQIPEDEKIKLADFILYNDEKQMLIPQVLDLHKQLILLSELKHN